MSKLIEEMLSFEEKYNKTKKEIDQAFEQMAIRRSQSNIKFGEFSKEMEEAHMRMEENHKQFNEEFEKVSKSIQESHNKINESCERFATEIENQRNRNNHFHSSIVDNEMHMEMINNNLRIQEEQQRFDEVNRQHMNQSTNHHNLL